MCKICLFGGSAKPRLGESGDSSISRKMKFAETPFSRIVLYRDSFHEIKWRSIFFKCRAMFDIYRQRLLRHCFLQH